MNVYIKRLGISAFAAAIIVGFAATHSSSKTEIVTAGVDISSAPVVCLEIPEATQQIEIDELPAPKEAAVVESLDNRHGIGSVPYAARSLYRRIRVKENRQLLLCCARNLLCSEMWRDISHHNRQRQRI